mgnify:CR=1 FL=1
MDSFGHMVETIKQQAVASEAFFFVFSAISLIEAVTCCNALACSVEPCASAWLSKGDLTIDVTPRSDKDILGKSLKRLVDNNNKALGSVQESTMQVTIGAEQVANASQALAQGFNHMAKAVH